MTMHTRHPAFPPSAEPAHVWKVEHYAPPQPRRPPNRAAILSREQVDFALQHIDRTSRSPRSDRMKVMLSHYGGLRAAEISGLTVAHMLNANGTISDTIFVDGAIAKGQRQRTIPMHDRIARELAQFLVAHPDIPFIAFSGYRRIRHQKPVAVVKWFRRFYADLGFVGCSSHSGRRSFITRLARNAGANGASLADIQRIAGHAQISTTGAYIEPDIVTARRLVQSI